MREVASQEGEEGDALGSHTLCVVTAAGHPERITGARRRSVEG